MQLQEDSSFEIRKEMIKEWLQEGLIGDDEANLLMEIARKRSLDSFTGERWMNGGRSGVTIELSFGNETYY
jgi:hypothetical protein